jgi:hypothetical protein
LLEAESEGFSDCGLQTRAGTTYFLEADRDTLGRKGNEGRDNVLPGGEVWESQLDYK